MSYHLSLLLQSAIIALLCLALYAPALHSPFMLDEDALITDNPIVKNLGYFAHPTSARGLPEYNLFITRYVSMLTLAINYRLGGIAPWGYHALGLGLHIANALLVLALARLLIARMGLESELAALAAALLYALHPLQSEAVIYIMARPALVCAFFYMSSILLYLHARKHATPSWGLYAGSLVCALLAMLSKQNAATLPLALALVEYAFLAGPAMARARWVAPYFALLLVYPIVMAEGGVGLGTVLMGSAQQGQQNLSVFDDDYIKPFMPRWEYLITQVRVVVMYLKLLLLPVGQNLLHHIVPSRSMAEPTVLAGMVLHAGLMGAGLYGLTRPRAWARGLGFGVLWFYLTLSVESSLIPIPMLAAEYRMYLPLAGLCIGSAMAGLVAWQALGQAGRRWALIALVAALLALGISTASRVQVWGSKLSMWQDVAAKSPGHYGAQHSLGMALMEAGRRDEAAQRFQRAYMLNPTYAEAANALAVYYIEQGQHARAEALLLDALSRSPDAATLNLSLGVLYAQTKSPATARPYIERAASLAPYMADARYNLGLVYYDLGLSDMARAELREALRLDPSMQNARDYLMELK